MTEAAAIIEEVIDDQTKATASAEDTTGKTAEVVTEKVEGATDDTAGKTEGDDKAAPLPDNWRELAAGGDEEAMKLLKRYGSLNGVAKALVEKEKLIRSGKIKQDMPDPKNEKAMAEWRKDQGIPDKPEGYVIPEAITKRLVDEDKPILASFIEQAHGKNAPPAFVEMAAEWYADLAEQSAQQIKERDTSAREAAEDALRDEWSRDEYKGNMTLAKRYMEQAGGVGDIWEEARLPDGRLLGSIPEFIKWASDQGRSSFGDVTFSSSDAETRHDNRRTEIEKIRAMDFAKYEAEGLDKELRQIIERDLKRGKK